MRKKHDPNKHPRYPKGTVINGVNVGGKFMPKDGKRAIEHLKRTGHGRATFLPQVWAQLREPREFRQGHIPGATLLPLPQLAVRLKASGSIRIAAPTRRGPTAATSAAPFAHSPTGAIAPAPRGWPLH